MKIKHIEFFKAVAGERNISRASQQLNISQSSVSRVIQELEAELGVPLFNRDAKGVVLTTAGEKFYSYATRISALIGESVGAIRNVERIPFQVNIGFCPGTLIFNFIEFVKRTDFPSEFLRLYELNYEDQIEAIRSKKLDIGFIRYSNKIEYEDLECARFVKLKPYIILPASHRLSGKKVIDISELKEENFITLDADCYKSACDFLLDACEHAGYAPNIVYKANGFMSALATISAGVGIGIFPRCVVNSSIPGFVYIPIKNYAHDIELSLIYRKDEPRWFVLDLVNIVKSGHKGVLIV